MRNSHSWILAVPFVWSVAASPAPAADKPTPETTLPMSADEAACGRIVGGVFAVKDVEGQNQAPQGVTMPTVVPGTKVTPSFSEAAVKAGGKVQLRAVVCKDGSLLGAQVLRAPTPEVGNVALDAFKKWKF